MRRILSLYLPWWRAERLSRRLERPDVVLIVRTDHGQKIVSGTCKVAHTAGVRVGLTLAHARALLGGASIHVADEGPHADAACLLALARWASKRWSPIISPDPPNGLLLDTSGCDHLFSGEQGLINAVERGVGTLGLTARAAIASTIGCAWAASRFAAERIVPDGCERALLAALPATALRIDAETIESLAEVGIEHVGQILDLPRHTLPARYGPDLLLRLNQALGIVPEMVGRTAEGVIIRTSRELPGGTTNLEGIERIIRLLLDQIAASLATHESGLRRLDATFDRLDAEPQHVVVQVARATRSAAHLWSLLRPRIERLDMGFGVERITLHALGIARLPHRQVSFAGEQENAWQHDGAFAALIDTLGSRLGRDNVLGVAHVASHRPERAFRLVPYDERGHVGEPARIGPRPTRLIDPPSPAQTIALSPDGPVMRVRWAGNDHRILLTVGPERIGPEWWRAAEQGRDYFRVQDERGRWLWMFREVAGGHWFVHGEWC